MCIQCLHGHKIDHTWDAMATEHYVPEDPFVRFPAIQGHQSYYRPVIEGQEPVVEEQNQYRPGMQQPNPNPFRPILDADTTFAHAYNHRFDTQPGQPPHNFDFPYYETWRHFTGAGDGHLWGSARGANSSDQDHQTSDPRNRMSMGNKWPYLNRPKEYSRAPRTHRAPGAPFLPRPMNTGSVRTNDTWERARLAWNGAKQQDPWHRYSAGNEEDCAMFRMMRGENKGGMFPLPERKLSDLHPARGGVRDHGTPCQNMSAQQMLRERPWLYNILQF